MKHALLPAVVLCGLASASSALAQRAELRNAESDPTPFATINLQAAEFMDFLDDGSLRLICRNTPGEAPCAVQNSSGGSAATIGSFGVTAPVPAGQTLPRATVGQAFWPTWASSGAEVCTPFLPTAVPSLQGWGPQILATSGSGSTPSGGLTFSSVPATQPVTLGLRCYGATSRAERTVQLNVQAAGGGSPGSCSLPPHPLIRPSGFTEHVRTWEQVFDGRPFPQRPTFAMPVGAFTVNLSVQDSPPSAGMYLSIPVTLPDNATLTWFSSLVTGTGQAGYNVPRPGSHFVSLSPCAGDLRPRNAASTDVFERCSRGMLTEGQISFSTRSTAGQCRFPPGNYFINIIHADPADPGFSRFSNTCMSGLTSCESGITPTYTVN